MVITMMRLGDKTRKRMRTKNLKRARQKKGENKAAIKGMGQ